MNSDGRLFVYDQNKWRKWMEKDFRLSEQPNVVEVKNGVILPLRKRKDVESRNGAFEGGVCRENGSFVAGLCRNVNNPNTNLSCSKSYSFSADIVVRHETVVFGGILSGWFSHLLTESFSRLWWYAENSDTQYKFIFLSSPAGGGFRHYNIMNALGFSNKRMEVLDVPTKFDNVIVPGEAFYMVSSYRPGVEKFYRFICAQTKPAPYSKVYLSRTALKGDELSFNEEYFEEFYKRRGYEIIHPEQLPFEEQLSIMAGAEEVVATEGGLVLLTQFCRPGTRVINLCRAIDAHISTPIVLQALQIDYYIVDAHFNFLPATLAGDKSISFLGPTNCWIQFLNATHMEYSPDEVSQEIYVKPLMYDYIREWAMRATKPKTYQDYHNTSLIDILDNINKMFFEGPINRKLYPDRDEITKLKNENAAIKGEVATLKNIFQAALVEQVKNRPEELQKAVKDAGIDSVVLVDDYQIKKLKKRILQLEEQLNDKEQSLSWRITKPLRMLKAWIKRILTKRSR